MNIAPRIELYRGPERTFFGTLPLMPIVRESLEQLYGWDLSQASVRLTVIDVPQDSMLTSAPIVENLMPDFGFTYVTVARGEYVVYQHPHPLDDLVTRRLQEIVRRQYPEVERWGFRLDVPGMPKLGQSRPVPDVVGSALVQPFGEGEKPAFSIRRLEDPDPPVKSLREFGVTTQPTEPAKVSVLVPESLQSDLCQSRELSNQVEEGGFLFGRLYRAREEQPVYLVELSEALTAEQTGASLLHFTFTGDSFASVKRTLRRRHSDERIVGWYHTHLFPATETFGLSSIDVTLHFSTFTFPWQVAGLINIDGRARVLRFYVREGSEMVQCPSFPIDPSTNHTESDASSELNLKNQ